MLLVLIPLLFAAGLLVLLWKLLVLAWRVVFGGLALLAGLLAIFRQEDQDEEERMRRLEQEAARWRGEN